jgi:hypothetical protein
VTFPSLKYTDVAYFSMKSTTSGATPQGDLNQDSGCHTVVTQWSHNGHTMGVTQWVSHSGGHTVVTQWSHSGCHTMGVTQWGSHSGCHTVGVTQWGSHSGGHTLVTQWVSHSGGHTVGVTQWGSHSGCRTVVYCAVGVWWAAYLTEHVFGFIPFTQQACKQNRQTVR